MGIAEISTCFMVAFLTLLVTALFGAFISFLTDEYDFGIFVSWVTVSIAFSVCLTILLYQNGFLRS